MQRVKSWPQRWRPSSDRGAAGALAAQEVAACSGGRPAHPKRVNEPSPYCKERLQSVGAASKAAASCRQRGQVLVITASDARAAKDLGKCRLGCKNRFRFPSSFLPLSFPPSALQLQSLEMCVLDWICFVSNSLGIWHWCYPEEGCFQLPKHRGLATVGRELGCSPMFQPGSAVPAESNPQPPRVEMQAHSIVGGQPAAPHAPDCKFILARVRHPRAQHWQEWRSKPLPWAASGQQDVCFPHPQGMQAPSTGSSGQETGRLVRLPVSCRRRHRRRQACGGMLGRLVASPRHLSRSRIQPRCGDGARWASGGPSSPCPGTLAQGPRDEFTPSLPLACPCSSLLPPRQRMLLPQPTPAFSPRSVQPLTAPGPQASLLSHRPAQPPGWAAASKGWARALGGVGQAGDGVSGP